MKVQAKIRVDADAEIIVHHVYLRIVLAGRASTCNAVNVSKWRARINARIQNLKRERERERERVSRFPLTRGIANHLCLFLLLGMEHHGPSVQYYLFRVDDVAQQVQRVLVTRVSRAPTQHTGEIVARS